MLALVMLSSLFALHCSYPRTASLQLRVRPVSKVAVHLLDIDPINMVLTGGEEHTDLEAEVYRAHPRLKVLAGVLNARRQSAYSLGPDVFLFLDQSRPLWEPHAIRSIETNAEGDARLDNLKPGSYWLMVYSDVQEEEAFWLRQIMIKDGDNEVVLEPGDALYIRK